MKRFFATAFILSFALFSCRHAPQNDREQLLNLLGVMPERVELRVDTLEKTALDGGWRYKIKYLTEPGDTILHTPDDWAYAYLFVPARAAGCKLPAVVAIHQDDIYFHIGKSEPAGLMGDTSMFYGVELFNHGYVVICPDRYYHAERRKFAKNPRFDPGKVSYNRDYDMFNYLVGMLMMQGRTHYSKEAYDGSRAVDVLYTLDYVDRERIGVIGHSAGGVAAAFSAAYDQRVTATVSSCGVYDVTRAFDFRLPQPFPALMAIPGLEPSGYTTADYIAQIAPRSLLLTRGRWEWGEDDPGSDAFVSEAEEFRNAYTNVGRGGDVDVIVFEEGGGGHSFPYGVRQQAYRWLDGRLKP